jgi:hypothetical protein
VLPPLRPHDSSRRHALLLEQVIGEGQRRAQVLPATPGTVLRQVRCGLKDQIGFRDQISERDQGTSVRWHTFTVRREWAIRKQSLFFPNADFRHYPRCVHRRAVLLFLEFWVQAAWAGITLSLLRGRTTRI